MKIVQPQICNRAANLFRHQIPSTTTAYTFHFRVAEVEHYTMTMIKKVDVDEGGERERERSVLLGIIPTALARSDAINLLTN